MSTGFEKTPYVRPNPGDSAFDHWLTRSLKDMYNSVSHEPIPDMLLRLVEGHQEDENPSEPTPEARYSFLHWGFATP